MRKPTYAYLLLLLCGCAGITLGADAHPAATAANWHVDPASAFSAIMKQLQELLSIHASYKEAVSITGWLIAGAGTILAIVSQFPGPAGVAANIAWKLLAPKYLKQQEEKQAVLAAGFHNVAEIMKALPKDCALGDVVCKLQAELPEPVKQAYREWEKSDAAPERPPTTAEVLNTAKIQATASILAAKELALNEHPTSDTTAPQDAVTPKA